MSTKYKDWAVESFPRNSVADRDFGVRKEVFTPTDLVELALEATQNCQKEEINTPCILYSRRYLILKHSLS